MKIEKKMPNDRWPIPVPAEFSKAIGIYLGGPVFIELEEENNRIILTSKEKDSEVNLVPQRLPEITLQREFKEEREYSKTEILEFIKYIIKEENIESELMDVILSKDTLTALKNMPKEKCAHCGAVLQEHEQLRINGKRICGKCKKIEVQKFLFYLERRKLEDEKEKIFGEKTSESRKTKNSIF